MGRNEYVDLAEWVEKKFDKQIEPGAVLFYEEMMQSIWGKEVERDWFVGALGKYSKRLKEGDKQLWVVEGMEAMMVLDQEWREAARASGLIIGGLGEVLYGWEEGELASVYQGQVRTWQDWFDWPALTDSQVGLLWQLLNTVVVAESGTRLISAVKPVYGQVLVAAIVNGGAVTEEVVRENTRRQYVSGVNQAIRAVGMELERVEDQTLRRGGLSHYLVTE